MKNTMTTAEKIIEQTSKLINTAVKTIEINDGVEYGGGVFYIFKDGSVFCKGILEGYVSESEYTFCDMDAETALEFIERNDPDGKDSDAWKEANAILNPVA